MEIRYTLDGTKPTAESPVFEKKIALKESTLIHAAMFKGGKQQGIVYKARYRKLSEAEWRDRLIVTELRTESKKDYRYVDGGMRKGSFAYIDRTYAFVDLPKIADGASLIMTANDDERSKGDAFLRFNVNHTQTAPLRHDSR